MRYRIKEKWKRIKQFPRYFISNKGKVKSYVTQQSIILQPNILKGYEYVKLYKYNNQYISECKLCAIHRLVAEYFCDGYTEDKQVHHKDKNTRNNNSNNLQCLTDEEHRELHKTSKEQAKGDN